MEDEKITELKKEISRLKNNAGYMYKNTLKKKDEKIAELSREVRKLKRTIEALRLDLNQMRGVYNGNIELQNINKRLERENDILKRKLAGEKIEIEWEDPE